MAKVIIGKDGYYRVKQVYEGVLIDIRARDETELEKKLHQRKVEIDNGIKGNNKKATFRMRAESWLEIKKAEVTLPVYKAYKSTLELYVFPHIGNLPIISITQSNIKQIVSAMSDKSAWLKKRAMMITSSVFKLAIADRIITYNPVNDVRIKLPTKSKSRALTDDEIRLFLTACERNQYGMWALTLYYTGIRPQESVPLKWSDFDSDTGRLKISKALKATGKIGTTKTEYSERHVILPDKLLTMYKERQGAPDELIFPTQHIKHTNTGGLPMNRKAMRRRWKSILRDMDIAAGRKVERNKLKGPSKIAPDLTLLCLRHTFATNLCRAGVDVKTAVSLMGHSDAKMIMQVYSEYTVHQEQKAREKLNTLFDEIEAAKKA